MNLGRLMRELAETIGALHELGATPVYVDDADDIARGVADVAKSFRCVTVGFGGCEHVASSRPDGETQGALTVQAEIVVAVYENPGENRSRKGAPGLLGMASAIAREVDGLGTDDMEEGLHFVRISPIRQLPHGVISCDVVFRTKNDI